MELANECGVQIEISGIESISSFNFKSKNNLKYRTYLTQEMLKKGYLASSTIFLSIYHTNKVIDKYIKNLKPIFYQIKKFEDKNLNIKKFLDGPVCWSSFKRLNT